MPLAPSLISSFSILGLRDAIANWPGTDIACELYCFMQSDLQWLFQDELAAGDNARTVMSRNCDEESIVHSVAEKINSEFEKKRVQIMGIASFLPEISDWRQSPREEATRALRFILRLSKKLRELGEHPLKTIELVIGSRAQGIFRIKPQENSDQSPRVAVNCFPGERGRDIVLHELATLEGDVRGSGIALAVEMEPGPLNILNHSRIIKSASEILELPLAAPSTQQRSHNPQLLAQNLLTISEYVGFNIDIAHWAIIEGSSANNIPKNSALFRRIAHAHISDHADNIHLGDLPFWSIAGHDVVLKTWINLLRARANEGQLDFPFSGYVSLELESARDSRDVRSSCDTLQKWLNT